MTAVLDQLTPAPASALLDPLLVALHRLDHVLAGAVAAAVARATPPASTRSSGDRNGSDGADAAAAEAIANAEALFPEEAGQAVLHVPGAHDLPLPPLGGGRLDWLGHAFDLEPFDLDLVILAIAPEVDSKYERLYAYLQDDPARRRPTVALALDLLCRSAAERIARRACFASDAPLVRHRLLRLPADAASAGMPLLAQPLVLDPQIANLLLGVDALDPRIAGWCELAVPTADASGERVDGERVEDDGLPEPVRAALPPLLRRAAMNAERCRVYLHGPAGVGKHGASLAMAAAAGLSHLTIDVPSLLGDGHAAAGDPADLLSLALRDAWLRDAVAYLRGAELLWRDERQARRLSLRAALDEHFGPVVLGGSRPSVPGTPELAGAIELAIGVPTAAARRRLWASALAAAELSVPDAAVDTLASRFRLAAGQIADATAAAARRLSLVATDDAADAGAGADAERAEVVERELFASARRETGHALAELATRIPVAHSWRNLVLPDDAATQLREICSRVAHQEQVLGAWGFGARLSRGRGVTALFSGSSGTGKTMAAEVIARELGLDLYRVELAGVVSKYIGETEKNLDRIFAAAEHSNAILLFDEADALFGKRSEVRDAHDRYANLEVSYLLQRMESYEGVAILATNLRGNLDAAFVRRLAFSVVFPFPDAASRRRIWEGMWPPETPLAPDVDLGAFAERFQLSGGNIRNIAIAAAYLAAEAGTAVTQRHLLQATGREYQKLGKTLSPEELA